MTQEGSAVEAHARLREIAQTLHDMVGALAKNQVSFNHAEAPNLFGANILIARAVGSAAAIAAQQLERDGVAPVVETTGTDSADSIRLDTHNKPDGGMASLFDRGNRNNLARSPIQHPSILGH